MLTTSAPLSGQVGVVRPLRLLGVELFVLGVRLGVACDGGHGCCCGRDRLHASVFDAAKASVERRPARGRPDLSAVGLTWTPRDTARRRGMVCAAASNSGDR